MPAEVKPLLHKFEGREVIATRIAVANAGDGLSAALAIEPQELTHGERVTVVLDTTVDRIHFEKVKDTDKLVRVQRLRAGTATIIDRTIVADILDAQAKKIEEARGIQRLDFEDDDLGGDKKSE